MNNSLLTLLKYKFINDFKLNKTGKFGKDKKNKPSGDTIKKRLYLYVVVGAIIIFYAWIYFQQMYEGLKPLEMQNYILPIFMIAVAFIVFIYSIRLTENVLFKSKDYEMLSALPIKPKSILSSKLIYILSINYFFAFLIMLPTSILFMTKESLSLIYVIFTIIITIFIPVIPIVSGALLSILIGYIATKFKFTNLITTVILLLLLLSIVFVPATMATDFLNTINVEQMDTLLKFYYPAYMVKNILQDTNILELAIYIGANLLIFIAFVTSVSKLYNYINQKLKETFKANKFTGKEYRNNTAFNAMLFKEIKKVLTTPMYLINNCFGFILILALSVITFFASSEYIYTSLIQVDMMEYKHLFITAIMIYTVSLSCTTGSSISLEGKNFWIYKTMPVKPVDVLISKLSTNILLGLPVIVIATSLFSIKLNFSLLEYILCMIVPIMVLIGTALAGLLINLKYPIFEFENDVYVIKRSLSSMLSIFIPLIFSILVASVTLALPLMIMNKLLILAFVVGIIDLIMYRILLTWGVKRFNTL